MKKPHRSNGSLPLVRHTLRHRRHVELGIIEQRKIDLPGPPRRQRA
jgi:hypothetical protein